jgi:sulfite reductase alpha subunit-like flavoprotein
VLDTTTLLQLTPPKYKVTLLPSPPPGAPTPQQLASLSPQQQEQLLLQQAVDAAAAFRTVAAEAAGLAPTPSSSSSSAAQQAVQGSSGSSLAHANSHVRGTVHGPWKPFMAPLLVNKRVTNPDHFQETRHLEFDLAGSGLSYQPGDLLAIFPRTPERDVQVKLWCEGGGAGGL